MRPRRGRVGVHGVDEGLHAVRVVALGVHQGDVEEELRGRRLHGPLQADEDGGAGPLLVRQQLDFVGFVEVGAVGEDDGDLDHPRGLAVSSRWARKYVIWSHSLPRLKDVDTIDNDYVLRLGR